MTPEVRPSQLPLEFRTGVVDYWAQWAMGTTRLRRLSSVIAGGSAIWRRVTVNR
jgi:hypothetical protein